MILNFLQTRNPPILPTLHKKPHQRQAGTDGEPSTWDDNVEHYRGFGLPNKETLGELLFNFFRYYAYDMEYEKKVVSVREGKLISKEAKKWHLMQNNRLCVEEPFNTERNLGNTADDTSFRGIHLELRRAFELVKEAKLNECLEEYVFPATEEKIWEKPPSKPPPVLTRSRSQSQSSRGTRGGYNNRGSRHGQYGNRALGGHASRRASSAAAMNKLAGPQIGLQNIMGLSRDQSIQAQFDQLRLHEHLYHEFQLLQAREQDLRLRQAQTQMQAQMQVQRSGEPVPISQQPARDQAHWVALNNHIPLTAPLRGGQYFHPFPYPQVPGTPQQNVHTQPSSPSMKPALPDLRRSMHRSSAADSSSSNHRSHSQPARQSVSLATAAQNAPPIPMNNQAFLQYQQLRQQHQLVNALEIAQAQGLHRSTEMPIYQDPRRMPVDQHYEETIPKEYMGYWVNDSPPPRHYMDDPNHRIAPLNELHPRVRGVPHTFGRLRNASRSPSPSPAIHLRDRSFTASSAPPLPAQPRFDRVQIPGPHTSGPVIVNGSDVWRVPDYTMPDSSSHTTTISEATSGSDDRPYETPVTIDETPASQGFEDTFAANGHNHYFYAQQTPDHHRMPINNRNGTYESTVRHAAPPKHESVGTYRTGQRPERVGRPAGGLGIQFGEHEYTHPSARANGVPPIDKTYSTSTASKVETKSEASNSRPENQPLTNPLLSPVRESRTPSPIARRSHAVAPEVPYNSGRLGKLDLQIPTYAELERARREKQNIASAQKLNGVRSSHFEQSAKAPEMPLSPQTQHVTAYSPKSPIANFQQPHVNGWQQQSGKKGKKNRSRPGSGQMIPNEPLPVNEAERKGG